MEAKEISELVKASIQIKIIEAFKSTPEMIDQLVASCLKSEVNEYGGKPSYNDHKIPFLTFLAQDAIQDVAREAVREFVETMKPVIKNQVKEKVKAGDFVDALSKALIGSTKSLYDIEINFNQKKD